MHHDTYMHHVITERAIDNWSLHKTNVLYFYSKEDITLSAQASEFWGCRAQWNTRGNSGRFKVTVTFDRVWIKSNQLSQTIRHYIINIPNNSYQYTVWSFNNCVILPWNEHWFKNRHVCTWNKFPVRLWVITEQDQRMCILLMIQTVHGSFYLTVDQRMCILLMTETVHGSLYLTAG